MKFVVYEVWTQARVIEATDEHDAYSVGEPKPRGDGMSLCNWHVVPVPNEGVGRMGDPETGGLNYRQVP